jgi:hypothetical protein
MINFFYLFIRKILVRVVFFSTLITYLSGLSCLLIYKSQAGPSPSPSNPGEIGVSGNLQHPNTLVQTGVEGQSLEFQKVGAFSSLPSDLLYSCGDYLTPFEDAQLAFLNRASRLVLDSRYRETQDATLTGARTSSCLLFSSRSPSLFRLNPRQHLKMSALLVLSSLIRLLARPYLFRWPMRGSIPARRRYVFSPISFEPK